MKVIVIVAFCFCLIAGADALSSGFLNAFDFGKYLRFKRANPMKIGGNSFDEIAKNELKLDAVKHHNHANKLEKTKSEAEEALDEMKKVNDIYPETTSNYRKMKAIQK
eukprot:Filipodium_phascolosomae@DN413_c0_g1_i1.p1